MSGSKALEIILGKVGIPREISGKIYEFKQSQEVRDYWTNHYHHFSKFRYVLSGIRSTPPKALRIKEKIDNIEWNMKYVNQNGNNPSLNKMYPVGPIYYTTISGKTIGIPFIESENKQNYIDDYIFMKSKRTFLSLLIENSKVPQIPRLFYFINEVYSRRSIKCF